MSTVELDVMEQQWVALQRVVDLLGAVLERLAHPLVNVEPPVYAPEIRLPAPNVTVPPPVIEVQGVGQDVLEGLRDAVVGQNDRMADQLEQLAELLRGGAGSSPAVSVAGVESRIDLNRRGVTDWEARLDYDARTDDQPVYVGRNESGAPTDAATWWVEKVTYDVTDRAVRKQVARGAWDSRASLFT